MLASALAASVAAGQSPRRLPPCPPPGDTLSLLQPSDSAYGDAPAVSRFLQQRGFVVRCVTRSIDYGLLGIGRLAGFQTDRGTITVFFLPDAERVQVAEAPIRGGYRYTFVKPGRPPARAIQNVNGRLYYLARGDWFIEMWDSALATQLRHGMAGRQ